MLELLQQYTDKLRPLLLITYQSCLSDLNAGVSSAVYRQDTALIAYQSYLSDPNAGVTFIGIPNS